MSCQARLFDWGLGVQGPWLRAGFIMPCEFDCAWELCKNKVQLGIAGLAKPVLKKLRVQASGVEGRGFRLWEFGA